MNHSVGSWPIIRHRRPGSLLATPQPCTFLQLVDSSSPPLLIPRLHRGSSDVIPFRKLHAPTRGCSTMWPWCRIAGLRVDSVASSKGNRLLNGTNKTDQMLLGTRSASSNSHASTGTGILQFATRFSHRVRHASNLAKDSSMLSPGCHP